MDHAVQHGRGSGLRVQQGFRAQGTVYINIYIYIYIYIDAGTGVNRTLRHGDNGNGSQLFRLGMDLSYSG